VREREREREKEKERERVLSNCHTCSRVGTLNLAF
jgi:hypothetical protein